MKLLTPYTKRDVGQQIGGAVLRNVIIAVAVVVLLLLVGCCRIWRVRYLRSRLKTERDIVDVEQPAIGQPVVNAGNQPIAHGTLQDPRSPATPAVYKPDPPPTYSK